jgi:hypothetical protein
MDLVIQPFTLKITFDFKTYSFQVSQTYLSAVKEIFTLTYGDRTWQLQSNRPLLRGKHLNRKRIEWKAIDGTVKHQSTLEKMKAELESYIKKIENPPVTWDNHPKNRPSN